MSNKSIAEILVETLIAAGVKRVFGVVGDSLNGILEEIGKRKEIEWIPVRHEETGAFAAGAQAHLTGELAVCAGSCGPGNMHLINGLYDCHRSRVPVLAIAAHIPSSEIGSSYFQETRLQSLLRTCFPTGANAEGFGNRDTDRARQTRRFGRGHSGRHRTQANSLSQAQRQHQARRTAASTFGRRSRHTCRSTE